MKRFFAILSWMMAFAIPAQAAAPQATVTVTVVAQQQTSGVHMLDDTVRAGRNRATVSRTYARSN
jgi:hypothetical protein